ncbi:N-6 DNA methylase [Flavobacterium flavigenum]|uniref:N-6 DNA methylase n=1 Tax=Flavobacterium flavigenum TaxID=3003258 RepID=UPI0022ABE12E|nr:N-6 DNA methylase [Flavobacterium flavigenum]
MLTKETKKRIDDARDTLVGVLPLPTDQIELITIGLIYKFMDDQDEELRQSGFDEKFFKGTLKDYSWQQLMSNQISADQRVTKFINGIEQIQKATEIPLLFKEIFQNAFLKFRDGKVLQRFLDLINGFTYSHSEELGNAFEYLLKTMGSQGDNGQFRTPKNIIDFIVDVVNPLKTDTILDPACGTGGFLVSSFKHLLRTNTKGFENTRFTLNGIDEEKIYQNLGDKLTTDERKNIEKNIAGYDNTPLMVRLARVNLYLHHFNNPKIHEYNTLITDTRWKDRYDCILANPPFMTPKGGIDPHNKFRIPANRTEILFSSYILQHLNSEKGKAGFIVPEGIIFTTSVDYVNLRKWLLYEAGLWAVVSLPANVFQPYSGVKTSILFIDKEVARNRTEVLMVKIENDGFSLNTNRSEIKENDLPEALKLIELCKSNKVEFINELDTDNEFFEKIRFVHRDEFAKLDAYKSSSIAYNYCSKQFENISKLKKETNEKVIESPLKSDKYQEKFDKKKQDFFDLIGIDFIPDTNEEFNIWFDENIRENAIEFGTRLTNSEISENIKKHIESYRNFDLGFNKLTDDLDTTSKYEMVRLERLAHFKRGPFGGSLKKEIFVEKGYLVYEQYHAINNDFNFGRYFIDDAKYQEMKAFDVHTNDILISCSGTMGKIAIVPENHPEGIINQALLRLRTNDLISPIYLKKILESDNIQNKYFRNQNGVAIQNVPSVAVLKDILIPLPPIEIQNEIIDKIDKIDKKIEILESQIDELRSDIEIELNQIWI